MYVYAHHRRIRAEDDIRLGHVRVSEQHGTIELVSIGGCVPAIVGRGHDGMEAYAGSRQVAPNHKAKHLVILKELFLANEDMAKISKLQDHRAVLIPPACRTRVCRPDYNAN